MTTSNFVKVTVLIFALPILNVFFNNLVNPATLHEAKENDSLCSAVKYQHQCTQHIFYEQSYTYDTPDFGQEMGKYIKDNFLPSENYRIKTVVIDPGHGGRDGGTSGKYAIEKNIVLKIAQKLGRNLQVQYPHIQILYTRQDDRFVSLKERARIANDNKADLFLSIHCNSLPPGAANSRVKGSETYVMGLHTAERNLEVAKRENASILYEQNYQQTYGGYDPNSPEGHIILSMYQNAFLQQSILLAEHIEKRMPRTWGRKSHGVKQAGFVVLKETTMPSVLIETGYLSNPDDERFLSSKEGQAQMALAILDAFSQYKHAIEDKASSATASNSSSTFVKNDTPPLRNNRPKTNNQTSPKFSGNKASKGISPSLLVQDKDNPSTQTIQKAKVEYKILLARTGKMADTSKAPWSEVEYSVQVTKENDTFKYWVIGFSSKEKAHNVKEEMITLGFEEAFVVAFRNGKRISEITER